MGTEALTCLQVAASRDAYSLHLAYVMPYVLEEV